MDVTFIYMMFVLKIPIIALLWIVWWAIHQTADPQTTTGRDDGGTKPSPHPRSPLPHRPRRGPHGDPPPPAPARVRARGRERERAPSRG